MNVCAICGGRRLGTDRWFLVAEKAHFEELVVHWMTTGSLGYPFPRAGFGVKNLRRSCARWDAIWDVDTKGAQLIGEFAVHRESMERVLVESPQSLRAILDALLGAL